MSVACVLQQSCNRAATELRIVRGALVALSHALTNSHTHTRSHSRSHTRTHNSVHFKGFSEKKYAMLHKLKEQAKMQKRMTTRQMKHERFVPQVSICTSVRSALVFVRMNDDEADEDERHVPQVSICQYLYFCTSKRASICTCVLRGR